MAIPVSGSIEGIPSRYPSLIPQITASNPTPRPAPSPATASVYAGLRPPPVPYSPAIPTLKPKLYALPATSFGRYFLAGWWWRPLRPAAQWLVPLPIFSTSSIHRSNHQSLIYQYEPPFPRRLLKALLPALFHKILAHLPLFNHNQR